MKTLYLTRGYNILIDQEDNSANRIESCREAIDRIYIANEPMHVVYGSGDKHCEADVKKGDIIITFYDGVFKNPMVVIKNKQWFENLSIWEKEQQEEKERWANAKVKCSESCDTCKES